MAAREGRTPASQRTPFVGREREFAAFNARLAAAGKGEGGVLFISGEPGVGKSRLLGEFARAARNSGWLVLAGRAYDTEGMPPYLPFVEAIRQYILAVDDADATTLLSEAPEITILLPELHSRLGGTTRPPSQGPEADRYRLFETVSDFFLAISRRSEASGLLLCLDDLHWADKSTVLLFQHLARKLGGGASLLVAGSYRTEEVDPARPLFDVLAELTRDRLDQRLALNRLSLADTTSLIEALIGVPPAETVAEAIHKRTAGNPFFVEEVVRQMSSEDRDFADPRVAEAEWDTPESIRPVIGKRLSRLSRDTNALLQAAAVLGDGFSVQQCQAMIRLAEPSLTASFEEASSAGMIREGGSSYSFAHPLIQRVIYDGLSLPRRQSLHLLAAETIETQAAGSLDQHLAALAHHFSEAGPGTDTEKSLDYAARAGDRAMAAFAYEEAVRLYELALKALEQKPAGAEKQLLEPELHVKRGEALISLGQWEGARPDLAAAVEGLSGIRRAEGLIRLGQACLLQFFDIPGARRYGSLAAELSGQLGRKDLEAAALGVLAQAEMLGGHLKASVSRYESAYSSEALRSPLARQSFVNFPIVLYLTAQHEAAASRALEALEAARLAHDSLNVVVQLSHLGLSLAAGGRYEEGLAAFEQAREEARARPIPNVRQFLSRAISMSAGVHLEAFDLAGAESLAEEARELGRSTKFPPAVTSEALDLLFICARRQEPGSAEPFVTEVEAALPHATGAHYFQWKVRFATAQAELALARADWREAIRWAEEALDQNKSLGRPKYEALALTAGGRALLGLGRKRDAIAELHAAVEVARPLGAPATFLRAAASLLAVEPDAGLAADARHAADRILSSLPAEMRSNFEAAEPVQLVYRLTGMGEAHAPPKPVYPAGLSEREFEVLGLIAAGSSNREIAEQLVLSVRTVERHITNIYAKIGARGKADATAFALRNSLN